MKLTESMIKTIIKEEINKIINENDAQTNSGSSKTTQQVLSLFATIAQMANKIKTDKEFAEYAGLEQKFYDFYQSGVDRNLGLSSIQNPDVIPLAAAAARYRLRSGKV